MYIPTPTKAVRGKRTDCVAWVITFILDARYGGTYTIGVPGDAAAEAIFDAEAAAFRAANMAEFARIAAAEKEMGR